MLDYSYCVSSTKANRANEILKEKVAELTWFVVSDICYVGTGYAVVLVITSFEDVNYDSIPKQVFDVPIIIMQQTELKRILPLTW